MEKLVSKAYEIILQNEDHPDLEAVWGYTLASSNEGNSISKNQVEKILKQKNYIYSCNGELRNSPNQEVW